MTPASILTWINGTIHEPEDARVSVFDRGFLYGDAVYELVRFFDGVGMGMDLHVDRLERSLAAAGIEGFDAGDYRVICRELLEALGTGDACIYLQVSRGVQIPRQHLPRPETPPTVIAIGSTSASLAEVTGPEPTRVVVLPDLRRHTCDIKATSLIENVMATMEASGSGANEPILQLDGLLTEGASSNIFVVSEGRLMTPDLHQPRPILAGVIRALTLEAARTLGLAPVEGSVPVSALRNADEAFVTSSRRLLGAITEVDGRLVGSGQPGPVTMSLFSEVHRMLARLPGNEHAH
jgi:D-alanine transaminase